MIFRDASGGRDRTLGHRRLRRRAFLAWAGGVAAWPLAAHAQQPPPVARLGVLLFSNPEAERNVPSARRALRELGYVEGRNLAIEYRYAEGRAERLPALAAELVAAKPDVLFSLGGDVSEVAVKATRTIPIVFTSSADPVQLGFVKSLAKPGGNATGVTYLMDDLAAKRLELLKQAAPRVSRVAFLWNPGHVDNELRVAERSARPLDLELKTLALNGPGDIDGALRAAAEARAHALYVVSSRLTARHLKAFVDFATEQRLPLAGGWGDWAKAGGLLSYGPNLDLMAQRAASYIDRILKGAKPADLPVQQPTKFELIINLRTAKALGLAIPEALLVSADEVLE
jgi:putative ABC transport system substrate-binding protein